MDWLTDRKLVVLNGETSDWLSMMNGVPQGLVVGPILFITYISDLETRLAIKSSKFVDDMELRNKTQTKEAYLMIQRDFDWCFGETCQMDFSVDKR